MKIVTPSIDRVLEKIEIITESGCWIFMGALNDSGYGVVGKGGRGAGNDRAHRITYQYFVGEIPNGMFVCHKCDVRSCCNPSHLFIGTNQDNVNDMVKKNRNSLPPKNKHIKGTVHVGHKLDDDKIRKIRTMREKGSTLKYLSNMFGVCDAVIHRICARKAWAHVL